MAQTVSELVEALGQFPGDMPVYITACRTNEEGMAYGEAGMEFPKPVQARMDPDIESELPEDARLGEFVMLMPEDLPGEE